MMMNLFEMTAVHPYAKFTIFKFGNLNKGETLPSLQESYLKVTFLFKRQNTYKYLKVSTTLSNTLVIQEET